jgi:hypothetical protein
MSIEQLAKMALETATNVDKQRDVNTHFADFIERLAIENEALKQRIERLESWSHN